MMTLEAIKREAQRLLTEFYFTSLFEDCHHRPRKFKQASTVVMDIICRHKHLLKQKLVISL